MTPADHNKTLWLIHGLIGILVLTALAIVLAHHLRKTPRGNFDASPTAREVHRGSSQALDAIRTEIYFLPLPVLQLLTAYGIFHRRRWGRILALVFSALYVWVFPLGTVLAIYTYWFLHSEGSKRLYTEDVT